MSDSALLRGLAAGDRDAIGAIFDAHGDRMVGWARAVVRDGHLAEDVIHDLIVRWLNTPPQTASYTKLGAFLYVAVRHAASDWIAEDRNQRGLRRTDEVIPAADRREVGPLSPAEPGDRRAELEALLQRALATVPEDDRELLEVRYGVGLPATECAVHLGIGLAATHKRLQRARERLDAAIRVERLQRSSQAR